MCAFRALAAEGRGGTEPYPIHAAEQALDPLALHPSECAEEVIQVPGHRSGLGQIFIRDRGRAHGNDDRSDLLMLPELPGKRPLRRYQSMPLSYRGHGWSPGLDGAITQDAP